MGCYGGMNERMRRILVTGIGGPAGRAVATYLKSMGCRVTGVDMRDVDADVDAFMTVPPAGEPQYAEAVLNIIKKEKVGLFVPTVTEELPFVARLKTKVERLGCTVFISRIEAVDIAHDKLKTALFLDSHDIPVPKTFGAETPGELILGELGLPLLSKPLRSRGGRGVKVYRTTDEFFGEARKDIVFQEFVPGEEFDINLFVDRSGEISASVVLMKTALRDGEVGNALSVKRVLRDDVDALGRRVVRALKPEGPLNMDVRLRYDGTPVVLEVNARVGGNVLNCPEILDSLITAWKKEVRKSAIL